MRPKRKKKRKEKEKGTPMVTDSRVTCRPWKRETGKKPVCRKTVKVQINGDT